MNVKIKLDRDELKALITILQILSTEAPTRNVMEFLFHNEINIMRSKFTSKLISPAKRFSLAVTNYQVALLFELLNEYADYLQPFERSIALTVIAQIDRQYQNHLSMLMNFMGEKKNNLLLSPSKSLNLQ